MQHLLNKVANTILSYSTNTSRSAIDIVRYYKARFQMEFIFRDGKQYTGLNDSQTRSEEKIFNHENYAMAAVNISKSIIRQVIDKDPPCSCSIQEIKTELFNRFMLERIFTNYDIDPELKIIANRNVKYEILIKSLLKYFLVLLI